MGVKTVTLALFATAFCLLNSNAFAEGLSEDNEEDMETLIKLFDMSGDQFNAQALIYSNRFVPGQENSVALNVAYTLTCYLGQSYTWYDVMRLTRRFEHYGCYCGVGGQGIAVDHIDFCCEKHDRCYSKAAKKHNIAWTFGQTIALTYATQCTHGTTTCSGNTLGSEVCYCDRSFGECTARQNKYYKLSNMRSQVKQWCVAKYGTV